MKHFLCRHIFIYVCVMFFVCYMYSLCCAYISRMANLRKISVIAPLDIKIPARLRPGKPALLPASGHKRSCPPPESAKLRDFFCTPQRAGIQRVTSVSREIPENFSKISSPKIWCVCQKSVPLHSQIRNEAYNTSQI